MMRMILASTAAIALAAAGAAHAARPTLAEAKNAVAHWSEELHKVDSVKPTDLAGAPALTSTPFEIAVLSNTDQDVACTQVVTDRAKLADALLCVKQYAQILPLKPWSKKSMKHLPKALEDHKATIAALAASGQLLVHDEESDEVVEYTIVAVTKDADGVGRVSAVFSYYLTH
jgi:hypothetical protein